MPLIIANGIKTNYLEKGEGESFIILHGWGSNAKKWEGVIENISNNNLKIIVPDLPGFGESSELITSWSVNDYVKWFEDFIQKLNLKDFYLLGYSFGGALSAKIAIKHPQKVKKLFLVASALIRKKTFKKNLLKKIAKIANFFSFLPFYNYLKKIVYKFLIKKSDYIHTEGVLKETYKRVIEDDISYKLSYIKVPTIIIWGEKDQFVPLEDAYFINKKIKNSKLIIIKEADHLLHIKNSKILAEKILENV